MSAPLSFKISAPVRTGSPLAQSHRPTSTTQRRPQAWQGGESDSDDDDGGHHRKNGRDELVTGVDETGFNKKHAEVKQAPLVIASIPNKDWREAAKELKAVKRREKEMYIPDSVGGTMSMAAGAASQGGMGTTDRINDSVGTGGLEVTRREQVHVSSNGEGEMVVEEQEEVVVAAPGPQVEETEEQRALRELLAGEQATEEAPELDAILPSAPDSRVAPMDESDAFRRDVLTRPDEVRSFTPSFTRHASSLTISPSPSFLRLLPQSTLEDYARVPVGQFGAAMLRGMGWKEGTAASRSGRTGPVEAFVPKSRPALLGIGAKPIAEVLGEEKGKNGKVVRRDRREDMKFVPLVKREREGGSASIASGSESSRPPSRRPSRSPPRIRDRGSDRDRDSDRDSHRSSKRPRSRSRSPRRESTKDRSSRDDRDRSDRDRDRDRDRRDRDKDRDRDRDSGRSDRDRDRYREKDRERDRERDDRRR